MDYTIATMSDTQGDIELNFNKSGDKYLIGMNNTEISEYTFKMFAEHKEAVELFQKMSMIILMGTHSYEDRKAMFN